jgi:hypothetical protein
MSLPSKANYYDGNGNILYQHFINVGWFLSEDNWIECVKSLPSVDGTTNIKVYSIDILYSLVANETELRKLFQEEQEEYRRNNIGLTKKEVETNDDIIPVKENTILTDRMAVMLPMIRKIMPSLIAQDIIGVQPIEVNDAILNIFKPRRCK